MGHRGARSQAAAGLLLLVHAGLGLADPQARPEASADRPLQDLVVTAPALLNGVSPLMQILPPEIEVYGADSLSDLLDALKDRTRSSRSDQKPLVLINGRLAGPTELDNLPPEAVERVDVLPERAAVAYGLGEDQLVVNFILRNHFTGETSGLTESRATMSEGQSLAANTSLAHIEGDSLGTVKLDYKDSDWLLESQRDIVAADSADRTLLPAKRDVKLAGTLAGRVFDVRSSLEASVDVQTDASLQGLDLDQHDRTGVTHLAGQLTGLVCRFSWIAGAGYDRTTAHSVSGTGIDASGMTLLSVGDSTSDVSNVSASLSGPLATLPAGAATVNLKLGVQAQQFTAQAAASDMPVQNSRLSRTVRSAAADATLPLTSRDNDAVGGFGDLSASLKIGVQGVSDFGTLTNFGYGLTWKPIKALTFNAAFTNTQTPPTVDELLDPVIVTPNVEMFDFVKGDSVYVTELNGGNPDLGRSDGRLLNLGLRAGPLFGGPTLTVDYEHRRVFDAIGLLPPVSFDVQSAFPERYERDASGDLVEVDNRHVNLAREASDFMRSGMFLPIPFGSAPTPAASGRRMLVTVYDTWYLRDTILVRNGIPELDLLNGSPSTVAAATVPRGQPKNTIEIHWFVFENGLGAELSGIWHAATRVDTGTIAAPDPLTFSALATEDFRVFANLEKLSATQSSRWAKGARITLKLTNLFDSRQTVHDTTGATPAAFQAGYVDPLGRVVTLSIRKTF